MAKTVLMLLAGADLGLLSNQPAQAHLPPRDQGVALGQTYSSEATAYTRQKVQIAMPAP